MESVSISIILFIFVPTIICAPTENSTSTSESTPTTSSSICKPGFCPEVLCQVGSKRIIVPPCNCSKCVLDDIANLTTITLANNHKETTTTKDFATGFPRRCRFECKVQTCKEGEQLVRDPNLICSCPRCKPVTTVTTERPRPACFLECPAEICKDGHILETDPNVLCGCPRCVPVSTTKPKTRSATDPTSIEGSTTKTASSTECILNCPLISCKDGEEVQPNPGHCQCPKCIPIVTNPVVPTQSLKKVPIHCDIVCVPRTCPPGETLYRNPSTLCGCPYCVPDAVTTDLRVSLPPMECKIACLIPTCLPGYILYRDPNATCSCPKCIFEGTTLRPWHCKFCPAVTCLPGEKLYRDPNEICACPKCIPDPTYTPSPIRTSRLSYECKITCPDLICPFGQRLEKDPRDVCSCPSCVADTPYTPEAHCDIACLPPTCNDGEVVVRDIRECSCPRCECIRPRFCPVVSCLGTWKYPACGCPICLPSYELDVY